MRKLGMVLPKFGDWYAPAARLVAAGAAAAARSLDEAPPTVPRPRKRGSVRRKVAERARGGRFAL